MTKRAKPRVYRAADGIDARVYVNGMEVFDVVAVCPAEGWADVIACKVGRDYFKKVDPNEWFLLGRPQRTLPTKRLYDDFRLIGEDGTEYE